MSTAHEFRTIFCAHCGHSITFLQRCTDRFCQTCGGSSKARTRRRIKSILDNVQNVRGQSLKFLTLTVRSGDCLSECVDHLLASFRKLRARNVWKKHVTGGLFVIEVTHNDKGFHAHIHAIVQMKFWNVRDLSRVWEKCSGAFVVDIREVHDQNVIGYLTSYLSKSEVSEDILPEVNRVLKGRRLFSPFGLWHSLSLLFKPQPFVCPKCTRSDWIGLDEALFAFRRITAT
jgi:hypothetical protein